MKGCAVEGCEIRRKAHGLCPLHYQRMRRTGSVGSVGPTEAFVNPLVCVCPIPKADPRVNWGQCAVCRRKPLALFGCALRRHHA